MRRIKVFLCLCTSLLLAINATADESSQPEERDVPEVRAYRINPHPPKIDGNLDDVIWKESRIDVVSNFTQREPDEGKPATESTLVAVVYDDAALYVAFWCYDSEPDKVDRQLVRRDRWSQSDMVYLRLDPFHDHQTGYDFVLTAAGVQRDFRIFNDGHEDGSWDAVWESAVLEQPWGWTAEIRIPYHCLRFAKKEEHTWGIDFARYISRRDEFVKWAYTPSSEGGFVSNFGHLTSITNVEPSRHLEFLPYSVAQMETETKNPGNPNGRDIFGNTGLDLKYGLSSNLTIDATINPDFGQVELDEPVLNLSTYETWFSERRPFFLEGSNLFETDFSLFYSRRIGRSPHGSVDDDELVYYTNWPKATTIAGASKLTGKLAGGTSIALLTAVTQEERAKYIAETNVVMDSSLIDGEWEYETISADSVERDWVVEPQATFSVLRVKQDILKNSSIGGMLTVTNQKTVHPATTGGVDWRLYTNNGNWMTRGQIVFSRVDNEHTGYGFNLAFEKAAGRHVRGAIGTTFKDPHLSINRLGYTSRSNSKHVWSWMQYRTNDDWWIIRNSWNNFNFYDSWNYDGVNYNLGGNFNTYIEFINYWSLGGGISVQAEKYSDLETRGNGLWEWPVYPTFAWWTSLNTDERKRISFNWNPGGGTDRGGSWWANYMGVTFRPQSNVELSLGANYHRTNSGTRWVENVEDTSVFADLSRDQVSIHTSASVLLNRNLSCQLSAQGLVSGLNYENYRYYRGGQNYSDPLSGYNNDYNYSALNSTFLVRWEYLPGSTLYLVWTRSRSEIDNSVNNFDISRDFDRFFSSGADNLFLIKASFWLNT